MKMLFSAILLAIVFIPISATLAATGPISGGIVHCVGDPCTLCDLSILADRFTRFLLFNVMLPIAALMILVGGVMLLTARDNQQRQTQGKAVLWYAVWGMIIAFAAWLIVSTFLATLGYKGVWYKFPNASSCVAVTGGTGGGGGGGGGSTCKEGDDGYPKSACEKQLAEPPEGTSIDLNEKNGLCVSTNQFNQFINEASEIYGIPAVRIRAIIMAESAGNPLAVSNDNDGAHSYGLMQIRPDTARTLDPGLSGLSDNEVIAQLQNPRYNINQGTRYYKQLKDKYGSNDLASAAYNGGPVANYPSVNCASQKRWQCEWDNNEHTIPNSRSGHPGYGPTRVYVPKINNLEGQIAAGACQ